MAKAAGVQLGLRLFLEGIEVPVVGAHVQININAPATASVQVIPSDRVLELKARTMVHLFFWDYSADLDVEPSSEGPNPLKGYRLLFSGEVVGLTMVKTPMGRQCVLQCADFSTYWDTTYQFFISYGPHGNFLINNSAVWAGGSSMFNDIIDGHTSVMNTYLRSRPKTPGLQDTKGLMGGLISLLEAMGGVPKHTHGVNDFFTIAELKNHLLQQIVAEQDDDTAQRLFDSKAFWQWLERGVTSLGEITTFRDMMKLLFQFVYYECIPNPAPMYVPGDPAPPKEEKKSSGSAKKQVHSLSVAAQKTYTTLLSQVKAKSKKLSTPSDQETAKSMTNTISSLLSSEKLSDDIIKNLSKAKTFLETVATSTTGADVLEEAKSRKQLWFDIKNTLHEADFSKFFEDRGALNKKAKKSSSTPKVDRLYTQIFRPDCFFAAPPRCNVIFPEQYTQFSFSRNFLQEVTRLRLTTGWIFGTTADGLLVTHHFAPATKDIAKIAKQQGNGSVRGLLPWEKFSGILPKFETCAEVNYIAGRNEKKLGVRNKNMKGEANSYAQRAANFNYMKYRFGARGCEVSMKFNPFMVVGFPAAIIERPFTPTREQLEAAVAKVNAGRSEKIMIDDASDHIRDIAREAHAPTQYLGMVAALSHNIDQSGGTTSATLTHARTHRITDDDFLNVFSKELTSEASKELVSTELDAVKILQSGDSKLLDLLIKATPDIASQVKQEEEQEENTDSVSLEERPTGIPDLRPVDSLAPFMLLSSALPKEQPSTPVLVDDKVATNNGYVTLRGKTKQSLLKGTRTIIHEPAPYSKDLKPGVKGPRGGTIVQINCVTDSAIHVTGADLNTSLKKKKKGYTAKKDYYLWRKIVIYEEIATKKTEKLIPVEEALRPPWFSPLYSNWLIGDNIYRPFFGTGAVTDAALYTTGSTSAMFGVSRNQQQKLLNDIQAADGDSVKIAQIIDKAKATTLADSPDIESSLDSLAYMYGEVRRMGLDVHKFVRDYTWRPIATMEDIFGTEDLEYKATGNQLDLVKGKPGFHSTAVANYGNLLGLLDNPDQELPRIRMKQETKEPISKLLDPRPERRSAVEAYREEIEAGKGRIGIGLAG